MVSIWIVFGKTAVPSFIGRRLSQSGKVCVAGVFPYCDVKFPDLGFEVLAPN